ncbi:MAG TPA: hypothetical protein VK602_16815 [Phyllobacterium sp.]|nr:hypothetical protein [Phyllobacterium sp.]
MIDFRGSAARNFKTEKATVERRVGRFGRRIDLVRLRSVILASLFTIAIALAASPRSFAAEQPSGVPSWLRSHIGEGEGQIAQPVLQRARGLYLQKVSEGVVKNPCYFIELLSSSRVTLSPNKAAHFAQTYHSKADATVTPPGPEHVFALQLVDVKKAETLGQRGPGH